MGPRTPQTPAYDVNQAEIGPIPHYNPAEYASLIVQHGIGAQYRKAILCPCIRLDTGMPRVGCPHCRGLGRLYPLKWRIPMIVLDTSRSSNVKMAVAGLMMDGIITLSFPPGVIPGVGDLVLPDGDLHIVQETLFRGGTKRVPDSIRNAPRVTSVAIPNEGRDERLLYPTDVEIEAAYYLDAGDNLIEARDDAYTLGVENRWTWRDGEGPEMGHAWTVRYRATACYMIAGTGPMFRCEADVAQPYKAQAKRLDRLAPSDLR